MIVLFLFFLLIVTPMFVVFGVGAFDLSIAESIFLAIAAWAVVSTAVSRS